MKKHSKLFEELILKSWWTILFFLLCFFAYDQAVQKRKTEESALSLKLNELLKQKEIESAKQEELQLAIASETDAAFIELVLMQKLGLVPEGQQKVLFLKAEKS